MLAGTGLRAWYVLLVVVATLLLLMIIRPFASAFLLASVLAGALYPVTSRLAKKMRGARKVAALIITIGVVLCIILPIATLAGLAAKELIAGIAYVREIMADGGGVEALVAKLPQSVQGWANRLLEQVPLEDIRNMAAEQGSRAAATLGGMLAATSSAILQTVFMLIMLFFLLIDGHGLLVWLEGITPMRPGQMHELLLEFRNVSRSVIVSALVTAIVQTVVAAVGYLLADVPRVLFFSFITFFCALIPAVGAAGVVLVLALLMLALGHPWAALFLAIWGVTVVGLVDNILKPILIKSGMQMHGVIVFFALIGGLAAFGAIGLIVGPLVVAFFVAVVRMAKRELGSGASAPSGLVDATGTPAGT